MSLWGTILVVFLLVSSSNGIPNCLNSQHSTMCDILYNYHNPEWVEYCCNNMQVKQCCGLGSQPCYLSCSYYPNGYNKFCCDKYKQCCGKKTTTPRNAG